MVDWISDFGFSISDLLLPSGRYVSFVLRFENKIVLQEPEFELNEKKVLTKKDPDYD